MGPGRLLGQLPSMISREYDRMAPFRRCFFHDRMLQLSSSGRRKLVAGTCRAESRAFASLLRRGKAA